MTLRDLFIQVGVWRAGEPPIGAKQLSASAVKFWSLYTLMPGQRVESDCFHFQFARDGPMPKIVRVLSHFTGRGRLGFWKHGLSMLYGWESFQQPSVFCSHGRFCGGASLTILYPVSFRRKGNAYRFCLVYIIFLYSLKKNYSHCLTSA